MEREEKVEKIVEDIESNENSYLKDPNELVMLDRSDFTNFSVFYEQYS